jgi:hypothetical protein
MCRVCSLSIAFPTRTATWNGNVTFFNTTRLAILNQTMSRELQKTNVNIVKQKVKGVVFGRNYCTTELKMITRARLGSLLDYHTGTT